jgi:hypothetical protein
MKLQDETTQSWIDSNDLVVVIRQLTPYQPTGICV